MRRRALLSVAGSTLAVLSGCQAVRDDDETTNVTPTPERTGTVENHRITAVEVVGHDLEHRSAADGREWVVTVTFRLLPQDPSTTTPSPVGVFVVYLDADDRAVYETYAQEPANTGETPRTVTLSSVFDPETADADTFARYQIDVVHG